MAVHFQSSQRRFFWFSMLYSFGVDYAIAALVLFLFGVRDWLPVLAFFLATGAEIALALYALLGLLKRLTWYHLFEKESRVAATASEISRLQLPPPEPFYNDADEYLHNAATSHNTSDEGRLFAGMILGAMMAQRTSGPRIEAMLTAMSVEAALQRVPPRAQSETEYDELEDD